MDERPSEQRDEEIPRAVPYSPGPGSPERSATDAGHTAGIVLALVMAAVVALIAVAAVGSARDDGPAQNGNLSCAAEHDEANSLFSDEEWCDLELNGGDGDGTFDGDYDSDWEMSWDDEDPFGQ
jgi:hypothetical protein